MKNFIFPAVLAVAGGLAFLPSHAQASWLSEAIHQLNGDYNYPPAYYGSPVYPSPYAPGYDYTPDYPYYAPNYYSPPVYNYSYFVTPSYPYGYAGYPRYNREWREREEHERHEHHGDRDHEEHEHHRR